jgi:hypothetical protein
MPPSPIRLGLSAVPSQPVETGGGLFAWRGETYYRICSYDTLPPFLISVVSDCDLWMYVASSGGLTAGRTDPSHALFPYETVDKLFYSHAHTGPRTIIRSVEGDRASVWQPFAEGGRLYWELRRTIYKHVLGCELWFEERNDSLGLTFRYGWRPGRRFGWVRSAELVNNGTEPRHVAIYDGVRNLMPAGVDTALQDSMSCLVDAYKTAERQSSTALALYRLTANIIDRAEASEALRTTVAWSCGLPGASVLLSDTHWESFIRGHMPEPEARLNGRRGSYLVCAGRTLDAGEAAAWHIVLDTPVDHAGVARLGRAIEHDAGTQLEEDLEAGKRRLHRFLAEADAFQQTGDPLASAHHVSNVLFNIARGGVLPSGYSVECRDVTRFVATRNRAVAERHAAWLAALPKRLPLPELHRRADATGDRDLSRICTEYLPIVFSRRHGDPSRPWNRFTIAVDDADGSPRYAYQGNWRDIFQNWEALCRSFPECLEPIIAKFVNASTMDGFNPYRVTHEGIEWEVADPAHPWSSIGYWGDHQIVYLLRLLEASAAHHPGRLAAMLGSRGFSYADVPYDLRPYAKIVADAQHTIDFNWTRQRAIDERVRATGTDGRLVHRDGAVVHVTMAEKLLVPALAKLSNLVPGGGVWMNTMRPEWNDANNALVGNGLSVVTTCHVYRYLGFCADLFEGAGDASFAISSHVTRWLAELSEIMEHYGDDTGDDTRRRAYLDAAGAAFSRYRKTIYSAGPGEAEPVATADIVSMLRRARALSGATVAANRRDDGLYHAYNILHPGDGAAAVTNLPLMLEGQVAALSSGILSPREAVALLAALRASALYRDDQHSYLLYPEKQLAAFTDTNRVSDSILRRAPTLEARVATGDESILVRDADGQLRFNANLHNAAALERRLDEALPAAERRVIREAYEDVFDHRSFTGRSGTMYRYEGIGCIYWHMVSKLALSVQECLQQAGAAGGDATALAALRRHYNDIRAGLGFTKSPAAFGAFPLDPYSHTPGFGGASQPGMTGQVKEEILARWGELGLRVENGALVLDPAQTDAAEFLSVPGVLAWTGPDGAPQSLSLAPGELAFMFCQVPIVYREGDNALIVVRRKDGGEERVDGHVVPARITARLFARTGDIEQVNVHFKRPVAAKRKSR